MDQEGISASDMRWNAFSGLLYGFKGFTWFVYNIESNNAIDPALFNSEGNFDAGPQFVMVGGRSELTGS